MLQKSTLSVLADDLDTDQHRTMADHLRKFEQLCAPLAISLLVVVDKSQIHPHAPENAYDRRGVQRDSRAWFIEARPDCGTSNPPSLHVSQ